MELDIFSKKLSKACCNALGLRDNLSELKRLSGGANMESWSFHFSGKNYVLRRMPDGLAENDNYNSSIARALPLETQAKVIEAAIAAGVTAPSIAFPLSVEDDLGAGFVMDHIAGETLPQRILNKAEFIRAREALVPQCAHELAAIHNIQADPEWQLDHTTPLQALEQLKDRSIAANCRSDICTFAFAWLEENAPAPSSARLLHGDFRMGNIIVDHKGLTAVLDWELAHLGDIVQDLAYFCTPSWRFGHYTCEAGGIDTMQNWIAAYEQAANTNIDLKRFEWWLIYNCLWWGVVCASMAQMWRDSSERSLERAIIGRRISEVEIDLVLLLEKAIRPPAPGFDMDKLTAPQIELATPDHGNFEPGTQDDETIMAISEWLSAQQQMDNHKKFEQKVALNGLSMAMRSARLRRHHVDKQNQRMAELGFTKLDFGESIQKKALWQDANFWDHLRLTAIENCLIDQPDYAGLHAAKTEWKPA
ncbi:phosphotransferase [Parasphingorhabdus sp. DH2-15]|uniref:phosphotransferase n=1 Tax=Parasphingorhabdus sp. DH2-15 TaxID=3444112 RepID=UPI003F682955